MLDQDHYPHIEEKLRDQLNQKKKVLPGITGLSQINYTGKKRKLVKKIDLDVELVNNYNLYNYFKIIIKTPGILFIRLLKNKTSIIE